MLAGLIQCIGRQTWRWHTQKPCGRLLLLSARPTVIYPAR